MEFSGFLNTDTDCMFGMSPASMKEVTESNMCLTHTQSVSLFEVSMLYNSTLAIKRQTTFLLSY